MTSISKTLAILTIGSGIVLGACGGEQSNNTEESTVAEETVTEEATQKVEEAPVAEVIEDDSEAFAEFFALNFVGKSAEEVGAGIEPLIDPELGLFIIVRRGNTDAIEQVFNQEQLKDRLESIGDNLNSLGCSIAQGELPVLDSEGEFDKSGCFYKVAASSTKLQDKQKALTEQLGVNYPESEQGAATSADAATTKIALLTEAQVELGFSGTGAATKLIYIDVAQFDLGI